MRRATTVLAALLLAADARATLLLTGRFIQLPIDDAGARGRFLASSGARYNAAGTGGAAGVDFWVHGTPVYNYTVSANGMSVVNGVGWAVAPTVVDTSAGVFHSAVISGQPFADLHFQRSVSFHDDAQILFVTDTLTNTGGVALNAVATLDNTDPDQDFPAYGIYVTSNDVATAQVPNDIVLASGPNSGLTVGFGSIDPRRVVDASGFENTNPFAIIAGPQDPNGASADIGINLAIDYGTLTAGSTISVPWYIVFGASQAAALMNLACGNGMLDPGEACDDGNLVPGDGCEATCTPTGCGDGSVAGAEECDDGNIGSGDCCSSGCLFEASGSSCPDEDGNECTVNAQCDGAGACLQEPASGGTACTVDSNVCTLDQCDGAGTCGHPPTPPGGSCPDDGNACTLDQCDGAGVCGHPPTPSGSSCPDTDGNACTVNPHCNGAGTCLQDPAAADTACQDEGNLCTRDRCDSGGVCLHLGVPQTPCRGPFVPRRGSVLLRADAITWRWVRGEATAFSAFGNPFSSTDYAFCVYDASAAPQPLMSARAPAGGVCTLGNPCWTQKGAERIDYNDALAADPDGITQIRLKSGIDGKASVLLRGKDPNLGFATPPLVPPVVVQLHAANGECWGATYSAPRVNDVSRFKSAPD